jgi:hypothetical protein
VRVSIILGGGACVVFVPIPAATECAQALYYHHGDRARSCVAIVIPATMRGRAGGVWLQRKGGGVRKI